MTQLANGRAIVDATEQDVYHSGDNEGTQEYYSGKKKAFTIKTQFVTDGEHHLVYKL
ncbi:MAG: transposase family protein [Chloroflexi bacterium]|nr:transposase family protein [Chloroflexota bacterium]